MLTYIQVSRSKQSSDPKFHKLYRKCFQVNTRPSNSHFPGNYQPGYIVGAVLTIGHLDGDDCLQIMDEANQQYYEFYQKGLKKKVETIHCYPIIASIRFSTPIKGRAVGNVSALKMTPELLKLCKAKIGESKLKALRHLCQQYDVTKHKSMIHRILILRKEHAKNTMLGIKSHEFRSNPLGEKLASKIKSKKDIANLLKYKKTPISKNVCKLKKFVSKSHKLS